MSSLAVFLVLGGATAFAVSKALPKKSVGAKQLKANAVTTAKIKKNAVTKVKIKDAAVDGAKIADGSVTGTEINVASTPFSRIVYQARGTSTVGLPNGPGSYPLSNGTYLQEANRDDVYVGAMDVTFQPSCTAPRAVQAIVLVDAANPAAPTTQDIAALGMVEDKAGGTVSRRVNMGSFYGHGGEFQHPNPTNHTFDIYTTVTCAAGSGVTATFAGVDVIGTK